MYTTLMGLVIAAIAVLSDIEAALAGKSVSTGLLFHCTSGGRSKSSMKSSYSSEKKAYMKFESFLILSLQWMNS